MPWYGWLLVILLAVNIVQQFYLVDRPRKRKTMTEAVLASIEICGYIWIVLALGGVL